MFHVFAIFNLNKVEDAKPKFQIFFAACNLCIWLEFLFWCMQMFYAIVHYVEIMVLYNL